MMFALAKPIKTKVKLYNRYIFNKTLTAFIAIALLLIALIWFSRTITFIKYITENGVEIQQVFSLFLLILPWLLLFIIPISLFIATLMIYNRMNINNEITILKNAGLTNFAIYRPIKSIAIATTIFCFFISMFLMPYANKKLRFARQNFENNYSNLSFAKGTFETLKTLTIYIKDKNEKNQLFGILLNDKKNKDSSLTITAQSGYLLFEDEKLLLYMQDGTVQRFNNRTSKSEILNFDNYVFNLSESNASEEKIARWKPKERYLNELLNPDKSDESEYHKYRAEFQQRLTYPLMPLVLSLLAVACMLHGNFSRHGNLFNILFAIILGVLYLSITITLYRLIETKPFLIPLLYLNLLFFLAMGFYILTSKPRKKDEKNSSKKN